MQTEHISNLHEKYKILKNQMKDIPKDNTGQNYGLSKSKEKNAHKYIFDQR